MASTSITVDEPLESNDYVLEAPQSSDIVVDKNGEPLAILTQENSNQETVSNTTVLGIPSWQWLGLFCILLVTILMVFLIAKYIANKQT